MSRPRRIAPAIAVAGLVALLTGCASSPPSDGQLVGRWEHEYSVQLTLAKDRTCTARLLAVASLVVSGTCTWRIEHGDAPRLLLDFSGDPSARVSSAELTFDGSGPDLRLSGSAGGEPWELTKAR